MSLWTDRELKALIARVNYLEQRLVELEEKVHAMPQPQPLDKRSREYRETIGRS